MHSTLPELSNPGPLCHNDKKAAREWAVQARYTQARLAKGRGVCSACRPAQRSLRVQTAQRGLGVQTALAGRGFVDQVAINTNAPGADGYDRHSGREKPCPRYAAGSDGGGGRTGSSRCSRGARRLGAGSIAGGCTQVQWRVDSEGRYKQQHRDAARALRGSESAAGGARRAG